MIIFVTLQVCDCIGCLCNGEEENRIRFTWKAGFVSSLVQILRRWGTENSQVIAKVSEEWEGERWLGLGLEIERGRQRIFKNNNT